MSLRLVIALVVALSCAGRPGSLDAQTPPDEPVRLRAGDAVRLQVADEPEMTQDYPVGEDGTVLLPIVGLVPVAGRPFPEVREAIRRAYAAELRDAPVVATPVLRIAVLGEVRQPGLVRADPTFTLADVLAAVGGLAPDGDPERIDLVREGRRLRLSLSAAETGLAGLRSGDQVFVGRRGWASRNLTVILSAGASVAAAVLTSLILR